MWLEKLEKVHLGKTNAEISNLNLQFELHVAIYIIEILKDILMFDIVDGDLSISLIENKKEIDEDKFFCWWQIKRYSQVQSEEKKLIDSFEGVRKKVDKLQKSLPKNEEGDSETDKEKKEKKEKKITDINTKLSKLANYMNKEGPLLKHKLTLLSNFRNTYPNRVSLESILKLIKFYLENTDN